MTPAKFKAFTKKYKVVQTKDINESGFILVFDNSETIRIGASYDGLTYTHNSEECKGDSKQLMKDLATVTPHFIENLLERYS